MWLLPTKPQKPVKLIRIPIPYILKGFPDSIGFSTSIGEKTQPILQQAAGQIWKRTKKDQSKGKLHQEQVSE